MTRHIVMLCSLDTKAPEAEYLKNCIEQQGGKPILIDIGYGAPAKIVADITAADVAAAAGSHIDTIYKLNDPDKASSLMKQGASVHVNRLLDHDRCDGVIAFGGASNTILSTNVMKELPVGIPKLMISSAAAMPAYAAMFFGSSDITIMHSVVDISGLNDLTQAILERGAGAICGMTHASSGSISIPEHHKLVAVTSFRFAEACSQHVMAELKRHGYTPIPFHAQGIGENAMEDLIAQGLFCGVVDIVPAGLSEQLLGGNRAARADRLEAAGRIGIPQVITPSGFDMISCGPIERRDCGDPLWEKLALAQRQISIPDSFRVEARTSIDEVEQIARIVAGKLNLARAPVCVMVPTQGWSSLSVKGKELYNPEVDAMFVPELQRVLKQEIKVIKLNDEINSVTFARQLVDQLLLMIEADSPASS